MQIRLRQTGAVMYESELRQYMRDNNGPTWGQTTPEILESIGADPVFEGPQPTTSGPYEYVVQQGVEELDGKWYTKYVVQTLDDEGKTAKDTETAKAVRDDRNRRLAETDWTQVKDVPDLVSSTWAAYRQDLRDLPSQSGFPHNVTWPNKPE